MVGGIKEIYNKVFSTQEKGKVAFSLPHGSLVLEVARHEVHATTAVRQS